MFNNKAVIINNRIVLKDVPSKPTIMIDKSTLQSLSDFESGCLGRYYQAASSHVLLCEIGADLKKEFDDGRTPEKVVSDLSKRLHGLYRFNTSWYTLLELSLLGHRIPIDGMVPVYLDGMSTYMPGIGRGIYLDEQQERRTLWDWCCGEFSEYDYRTAERWRSEIKKIDLTSYRDLGNKWKDLKAKSLEDIPIMVENVLNNLEYQLEFLQLLVKLANISEVNSTLIFDRWLQCGMPSIQDFSQYGYYCLKVHSFFACALFSGLVGARSTNLIDLHYLYELPFCRIFSSYDKFHVKLVRLLMTDQQIFINGQVLKADLKQIEECVSSLSEEDQTEIFPFPYPPDWEDSFTSQVWKKYVMPREEFKPFTQEEKDRILEQHRRHQEYNSEG